MAYNMNKEEMARSVFLNKQQLQLRKLEQDIDFTNIKFRRACHQIQILNNNFKETEGRFLMNTNIASDMGSKAIAYCQRINLSAYDGVRSMFNIYAHKMAQQLDELKIQWTEVKSCKFEDWHNTETDSAYGGSSSEDNPSDSEYEGQTSESKQQ